MDHVQNILLCTIAIVTLLISSWLLVVTLRPEKKLSSQVTYGIIKSDDNWRWVYLLYVKDHLRISIYLYSEVHDVVLSALSLLKIPYSVTPVVRIPITNPPHTNALPILDMLPLRSSIFCANIPGRMKLIIDAAVPPASMK